MYWIWDNYHEEWYCVQFEEFEDAEREMEYLISKRKAKGLPYDFDKCSTRKTDCFII